MIKNMYIITLLLLALAIVGCQKDSVEFIPNNNQSEFTKSNIFGIVLDENDNAVENATINYRGEVIQSDQYGIYTFNNVDIDSKHNVLNISKNGYHLHSRTFRSKNNNTVQLRSKILPLEFNYDFQSAQGGIISKDNASVTFKANSIVYEENGADYQGEVKVAMHYSNSDENDLYLTLPGDLSTINQQNEIQSQIFYGAVSVVLQSPDGQMLQIKNDHLATLKLTTPSNALESNLSAGSFDHNLGLWKEEALAIDDNGTLVAELPHFTWWNIYKSIPHIIIDGRVIDQNGTPLSNMYIRVYNDDDYISCYGSIDSDGTFGGLVPQGESLRFKIYDIGGGCDLNQPVYDSTIGPFSQDTPLADIVIVLDNSTLCTVTGTVVDCDGIAITDGFIKLGDTYFQVTNGEFDASIVVCDNEPINFIATNRASQLSSTLITVNAPGTNTLATISVCDSQADFLTLNCDEINLALNMNEQIDLMNSNSQNQTYLGFSGATTKSDTFYTILFTHFLPPTNNFDEGSYTIHNTNVAEMGITIRQVDNIQFDRQFKFESATLNITQGGGVGDVIKGNYTYKGTDIQSNNIYDFYGTFQILY